MLRSEQGHIANGLTSILAITGAELLASGLGQDITGLSVAGAIVLGLSSITAVNAPHVWLRSVYRRLDKVDPEDKESMPDNRRRIQL